MIPLFFWGRKSGKTFAAQQQLELKRWLAEARAKQQLENATLLALTKASVDFAIAHAQAQASWQKYALPKETTPLAAQPAMSGKTHPSSQLTDAFLYRYCPAHPFLNNPPPTMILPYRVTREINTFNELEIFRQLVREIAPHSYEIKGTIVSFLGTAEEILKVDTRFQEIKRANEENERVRNTPPPTSIAAALGEPVMQPHFPAPTKKNRCYESITQVEIKGPNSGERYGVRVWRSLFILAIAENTLIQQWASQLNEAIDSMSPLHRKQTVNEAWIISRLEHFTSMGEHRIVAVEVKDKDGCGKLLYPDWS